MSEVLKRFGKYFLLDAIAQGGMAEIYRARPASIAGGRRLMVIKRIQAGYGGNSEFLSMFKSEINVTMGFNHPNIVQLYDFGEEQNQPFIAMELVDGKNVRQLFNRISELKQTFPIELAASIIEQAASGLHYAHSYKDKITGEPLNIVHRDISPQNILVSYEGNVKVIDFGIAKATTNSEATQAGVIKGKPSYLSPEQITGEVLDGRSDIFALGSVLWEILTGKKLFSGDNDLTILKKIESCQTHVKPPSTFNPSVPKELDYITLRCLARQREKRYQTAEELQRALHKFLNSFPDFNPSDLAYISKELFKNEIIEDRKKILKLNDEAEKILNSSNEVFATTPAAVAVTVTSPLTTGLPSEREKTNLNSAARILTLESTHDSGIEMESASPATQRNLDIAKAEGRTGKISRGARTGSFPAPQQRKQIESQSSSQKLRKITGMAAAGIFALSIVGPGIGIKVPILSDLVTSLTQSNEDESDLVLDGNQKNVTVTVNGQTVAHSLPATLNKVKVGTPLHILVTGVSGSFQQIITLQKGEKKLIPITLSPDRTTASSSLDASKSQPSSSEKLILLKLNITPAGGQSSIHINNKEVDSANPQTLVGLDSPLELMIEKEGFSPLKREFVVSSQSVNTLKEWTLDIELQPLHFGFLTIHSTPSSDVTITSLGSSWKRKTPLENEKIPAGNYTIRLTNEILNMGKTVQVNIVEGKPLVIDEQLEVTY